MDKKTLLKNIVKSCEARFNRGTADNWKHSDFNDFSREILKETKTNISYNTLKRIFGKIPVDDYYQPQQATIDALTQYSKHLIAETDLNPIEVVNKSSVSYKKYLIWSTILVSVLAFVLCFLNYHSNISNVNSIKLSNTEGLLPKTALFDIELPNTSDSIFVNFGDKSPLIYLVPKQKRISHTYLFPGLFNVNIQNSKNILAQTKIYVASNKWYSLGFYRQREIPNSYYASPAEKKGKDSLFYISNIQLQKAGLDTLNSYYTRLCNFTPINYLSDNFKFETTLKKDTQKKGIFCSSIKFQISGSENMIRFNFVSSGCSSKVINVISEQYFYGTKSDLSKFVINLEKWNTLKLINRNKNLELFINNTLLFKGKYKKTLGELRGVMVEFEGNGYVKECKLNTLKGKELYHF